MADRILPVGNGGVLGSSKSMSKMRVNTYRDRAKSLYQRYALMDDDFWIGNIEIDNGSTLPSQWVQDELYIFDTQLSEAEVQGLMKSSLAVETDDKLATTWGHIKKVR